MRRPPYREALRRQFAKHAEKVRKDNDWSYAEIAARLGITKQAYAKYRTHEPGISSCPTDRVLRKARECIGFKEFQYGGAPVPTGFGPPKSPKKAKAAG